MRRSSTRSISARILLTASLPTASLFTLTLIFVVIPGVSLDTTFNTAFAQQADLAQTYEDGQSAIELVEPKRSSTTNHQRQPRVGRRAAEKYMGPNAVDSRAPSNASPTAPSSSPGHSNSSSPASSFSSNDHYLALHLGTFVSDTTYKWGAKETTDNVGRWNVGVTYRMGEWTKSMDLAIRLDLASYALEEGHATKLSFLPVVMFPEASSRFPLYFGAGIGPGIFTGQISQESSLSLDYQILAGARFFDVVGNTGFFIEAGLKNHIFLLSDGQFNGTFVALGTVFSF